MAKGKGRLQAGKILTRSSASPGSGDLSRHAESARSEIPAPVFYPSGRLSDWLGPTLAPGFFVSFLSGDRQAADPVVFQAAEVELVAHRLRRGDHAQVVAAGVVQAADDLALFVDGDDQPVGGRQAGTCAAAWPAAPSARDAGGGSRRWPCAGSAGPPRRYPCGRPEVVRQARQVVDEHLVLASLLAFQPVAGDAIAVGLVDQYEVLVCRECHAIGEVQVLEQHLGLAGGRVVAQQAAVVGPRAGRGCSRAGGTCWKRR